MNNIQKAIESFFGSTQQRPAPKDKQRNAHARRMALLRSGRVNQAVGVGSSIRRPAIDRARHKK